MKSEKTYLMSILSVIALQANAQSVSYNHDESKMNQFTVGEVGIGELKPSFYYDALHNTYQKTAAQKNKLVFRTAAGLAAYQQVPLAEAVDSTLKKRAEIEALNIADRSGGALDVAWMAEGEKITKKLADYEANISRILSVGGTVDNQRHWKEYADMFKSAIKAMQDAYQPNAQRKRQYLSIYADICRKNEQLVKYIAKLSKSKTTASLLGVAPGQMPDNKAAIVANALNRWRDAGLLMEQ